MDGISSYILKTCATEIFRIIAYLINKSITDGVVPCQWKIAKIIPLHKKGDKCQPDNYRPISLLPCVSKLLERVVQKQLLNYLNDNDILVKEQSGFRSKHSTTTALIKVTDKWLEAIDQGKCTGCVFVDLHKAFDTVNHQILIKKLSDIGVQVTSIIWFQNYLMKRRIRTSIGQTLSEELSLDYGVPQGSILGATAIFSVYKRSA